MRGAKEEAHIHTLRWQPSPASHCSCQRGPLRKLVPLDTILPSTTRHHNHDNAPACDAGQSRKRRVVSVDNTKSETASVRLSNGEDIAISVPESPTRQAEAPQPRRVNFNLNLNYHKLRPLIASSSHWHLASKRSCISNVDVASLRTVSPISRTMIRAVRPGNGSDPRDSRH